MKKMIQRIGGWCFTGLTAICIGFLIFSFSLALSSGPVAFQAIRGHAAQLTDHERRLQSIEDERTVDAAGAGQHSQEASWRDESANIERPLPATMETARAGDGIGTD